MEILSPLPRLPTTGKVCTGLLDLSTWLSQKKPVDTQVKFSPPPAHKAAKSSSLTIPRAMGEPGGSGWKVLSETLRATWLVPPLPRYTTDKCQEWPNGAQEDSSERDCCGVRGGQGLQSIWLENAQLGADSAVSGGRILLGCVSLGRPMVTEPQFPPRKNKG